MNSKPRLQLLGAYRQILETSLKCVYITGSINFEKKWQWADRMDFLRNPGFVI